MLADRDAAVRQRARELGLGHRVADSAAEAAHDADHIILCVPVGACGAVAAEIASVLKPGAILSDVGSVKNAVVEAVTPHLPDGVHFVPAHPVAGTENSGPDAGFSSLFLDRWCILTPPEGADENAVARTRQLWEGMGAIVEVMTPQHHDLVLGITSHLPHLIAYTIVGTAEDLAAVTQSEVIKFSAGGFSRFHPHRRIRSDDVARRLPAQQGRCAGDARTLQRGSVATDARHPLRRRRDAAQALHPDARSGAASSRWARKSPRRRS